MSKEKLPTLKQVTLMYEGIYPRETIRAVYRFLRERIDILTPIVEANEKAPLITQEERDNWEKGEGRIEAEKKIINNKSTKDVLESCQIAWERLINGNAHLCRICGAKISKDRKQAQPQATTCISCRQQKPIYVH
jgi:RNA polymerase-binding transcription factor DksA